jgi:hypothetical protein
VLPLRNSLRESISSAMPSTRSCKTTAILTAVVILALPAAADARTHRFTAATDVTVGFKLPKPAASGTLVVFARNQLAVTRWRGALTLRATGRRGPRVALAARGETRVIVELSAIEGTARLSAGGKTAIMGGRFVAENAVAVPNSRLIVSLRTRTAASSSTATTSHVAGSAGVSPSAPAASPPHAATATTSVSTLPVPMPPPLFAADSVWNAPLAADAPLDPAGPSLVQKLRDTVAQNQAARTGPWIATNQSGTPLYRAVYNQPRVRVQLHTGWWGDTLQTAYESVPIPVGAKPGTGADGHMALWQPYTDTYWEFFHMRQLADGWHADYGGAIKNVSHSAGYFSTASWPGLSQPYWGATASSLPLAGGLMRISELKYGVIPHALALAIPFARPKTWSFPAQRTDGSSPDLAGIPEGARFRIDPTLDLNTLVMPRMTRMMAVAAQRYGIVVTDQTGWAVGFRAEDNTPTGTDPYYGTGGLFGGLYPNDLLASFPWDHLQLMKMDLHTAA